MRKPRSEYKYYVRRTNRSMPPMYYTDDIEKARKEADKLTEQGFHVVAVDAQTAQTV